jgi:hypothetical protein
MLRRLPNVPLELAFATWGYNTDADAVRATSLGVAVYNQQNFAEALAAR